MNLWIGLGPSEAIMYKKKYLFHECNINSCINVMCAINWIDFVCVGQIFQAPHSIALRSQDPKTSRTSFLPLQHFTSQTFGSAAIKHGHIMLICISAALWQPLLLHDSESFCFHVQGWSWRGWSAPPVLQQWRNRQGLQVLPVRSTSVWSLLWHCRWLQYLSWNPVFLLRIKRTWFHKMHS